MTYGKPRGGALTGRRARGALVLALILGALIVFVAVPLLRETQEPSSGPRAVSTATLVRHEVPSAHGAAPDAAEGFGLPGGSGASRDEGAALGSEPVEPERRVTEPPSSPAPHESSAAREEPTEGHPAGDPATPQGQEADDQAPPPKEEGAPPVSGAAPAAVEEPSPIPDEAVPETTNGGVPAPVPTRDEAPAAEPPSGAAPMRLSIPALGLEGAPVLSDPSEAAMERGVVHVPSTGLPGRAGSNTYLAGHRVGYPGTGSDRVFWNLPALKEGDLVVLSDRAGSPHEYRVTEAIEVSPLDTWVVDPLPGREVVTLQTCIEDFGDQWGDGPDWLARYVVRADKV